MRLECPKCCKNTAWLEKDRVDITLRCLCGYLKVVKTRLQHIEIIHSDVEEEVKLPRKGTKLWDTLKVLESLKKANSVAVTERMIDLGYVLSVNEVSSYLTMLRTKGLVSVIEYRKGLSGGSTWVLSDKCIELLGVTI